MRALQKCFGVVLLSVLLPLAACTESAPDPTEGPAVVSTSISATTADDCRCPPAQAVVDPALLAFLSKAKSLHNQADMADAEQDTEAAIKALDRLVAGPLPAGDPPAPEVREVMADTLARSAELRSRSDYQAALKDIDRGLSLARERSHYRGRLMEVLGVVEQREFKRLQEAGDDDAPAAKERALKAFEEAVAIQDDVIKRALSGPE